MMRCFLGSAGDMGGVLEVEVEVKGEGGGFGGCCVVLCGVCVTCGS